MDLVNRLARGYSEDAVEKSATAGMYKPRNLTEQLTDKVAFHKAEIAKIEEALASLTPDVERALNALSKL